jgi:Fe-S-cluster containining protein
MHEKVHVFVDSGEWYLQVWTRCQHLLRDNRCGVYETRPQICREYGFGEGGDVNCHATSEPNAEYDLVFTEAHELEAYYQKWYENRYGWRKKKTRRKNP